MNRKPQCIIITGRPGSGKTTLAKKLGERLWMPVISRDEIKEGYVNTYGVKHDQLPADMNAVVSNVFFDIVHHYLTNKVSIIIEAALAIRAFRFTRQQVPCLLQVRMKPRTSMCLQFM